MTKNVEPPLEELLSEPIVRLVMARDGLDVDDVRFVMERARDRLGLVEIPQAAILPKSATSIGANI